MPNTVEIVLRALDQTRGGFAAATRNLSTFQSSALGLAKVAVATFAATGSAMVAMAHQIGDAAEEMLNFSERTGISVEDASRLKFVAKETGVSFEVLEKGLRKASEEAAKSNQSLQEFLISQADRFSSYQDGASKAAEAQRLFGKSGSDLIPILNKGSAALKEQLASANDFATVFDKDGASSLARYADNIDRIGSVIKKNLEESFLAAAPSVEALSEELLRLVAQLTKVEAGSSAAASVISVMAEGLRLLAKGAELAITGLSGVTDILASLFIFPTENNENALQAIEELKKAWTDLGNTKPPQRITLDRAPDPAPFMADPKDMEKFQRMYQDLLNSQLRGSASLLADAEEKHQRRVQQIQELKIEEEKKNQFIRDSEATLEAEKFEMQQQNILFLADLDQQRKEANIAGTLELLSAEQAANLARAEDQRVLIDLYVEQWRIAHQTIANFAATLFGSFSSNFGSAISNIITGAQSAREAFANLGKAMLKSVADYVGQWIAAQVTMRVMQAVFATSTAATTAAAAASIGAAWAGPAALASLASFGSNAGPATAAIASTVAFSKAASIFGGIAHGGLDYVPRESTYLLDRGERVISPSQNADLTEFLSGGGSGPSVVEVYMDGDVIARGLSRMSRDGRLTLSAKAIS